MHWVAVPIYEKWVSFLLGELTGRLGNATFHLSYCS